MATLADTDLMPRLSRLSEAITDRDLDLAEGIVGDLVDELEPRRGRFPCPSCDLDFEFPGLRDAHLFGQCERAA